MLTNENRIQKHWSLISWKPALYPYFTLNTDGSSFGNPGITGFGAVLRGADGIFKAAVTDGLSQGTTFLAEAMGVRMGLMMARDCGVTHLQLQVDSTSLLPGILEESKETTWTTRHIFADINNLISTFISFNVISIFREGNVVADALAKLGSTLGFFRYWNAAPPDIIKSLLTDDLMGRSTPRCISTKLLIYVAFPPKKKKELGSQESSAYVLLSSIYSSMGRREDVKRVRRLMKHQGVAKAPGCSWIEIKNPVHVFVVGDQLHPQINKIRMELKRLTKQMKDEGYRPVIDLLCTNDQMSDDI